MSGYRVSILEGIIAMILFVLLIKGGVDFLLILQQNGCLP